MTENEQGLSSYDQGHRRVPSSYFRHQHYHMNIPVIWLLNAVCALKVPNVTIGMCVVLNMYARFGASSVYYFCCSKQ
jgi:hypothetical protein